jgi:hypothetical protein
VERVTFALAFAGYVGLTATAVIAAHGRLPLRFWRAVALVILVHVVLVWTLRYEWRYSTAVRHGYTGFLAFHGALAMIVASVVLPEHKARLLVWASFAVVSLGAIGAVFRYDVVAPYRIPVILTAIVGTAGLVRAHRRVRRR